MGQNDDIKQWSVYMNCAVRKVVTCGPCTEEQARNEPFEFATDEQEIDQVDWDVTKVEASD